MAKAKKPVSFDLLTVEKLPYLVTILIALVGWGVTHIVDRVLSSPRIEYVQEVRSSPAGREVRFHVVNLSVDKVFRNLTFLIRVEEGSGDSILWADWMVPPPIRLHTENPEPDWNAHRAVFQLFEFQPRTSLVLIVCVRGPSLPKLRLSGLENAVNLQPRSVETILARYELEIVAALVVLWVVLTGWYLVRLQKKRSKDVEP